MLWPADGCKTGHLSFSGNPHSATTHTVNGSADRILILGIGNVLMGDEGVGVQAIRFLEQQSFPPHVHLLDGGTGGFTLLSYLQEYPTIIMIDATMDGQPPGTVTVLRPRFASDFPRVLSAHDIGLRDLVEAASLTGTLPEMHLIAVSIATIQSMQMELSPEVGGAIPAVAQTVRRILQTLA